MAELEKSTSSNGNTAKDKRGHIISLQAICELGSRPLCEVPWAQAGCRWLRPTYVVLEGVGGRVTGRMSRAQKKRSRGAKACCNLGSLEQGEMAGQGKSIHRGPELLEGKGNSGGVSPANNLLQTTRSLCQLVSNDYLHHTAQVRLPPLDK